MVSQRLEQLPSLTQFKLSLINTDTQGTTIYDPRKLKQYTTTSTVVIQTQRISEGKPTSPLHTASF